MIHFYKLRVHLLVILESVSNFLTLENFYHLSVKKLEIFPKITIKHTLNLIFVK